MRGTVLDGQAFRMHVRHAGDNDGPQVPARKSGGAKFNPGVSAIADGTTQVALSHRDGGFEDVTFTVDVVG